MFVKSNCIIVLISEARRSEEYVESREPERDASREWLVKRLELTESAMTQKCATSINVKREDACNFLLKREDASNHCKYRYL